MEHQSLIFNIEYCLWAKKTIRSYLHPFNVQSTIIVISVKVDVDISNENIDVIYLSVFFRQKQLWNFLFYNFL